MNKTEVCCQKFSSLLEASLMKSVVGLVHVKSVQFVTKEDKNGTNSPQCQLIFN